ncbi:ATP-binding protein [Streptomyces sp. JJ66]|uniref:ATP-binding protein n=1 Tax=Streptomyces sp. JJ66 TaxID=2803843 RepID=UPI001C58022D|nr:ATP-binding protein [Streptomyces sp. JJ66]MBW1603160.1 ATP-binding protein [Streptomyces sp. JJ66]
MALAAEPSAVGCARLLVRTTLAAWRLPELADDASLVVSELVANAVAATGHASRWAPGLSLLHVRMLWLPSSVAIEVADVSREEPVLHAFDPEAEGGRGLQLVAGVASRWGSAPAPWGKVVWAELPPFPVPR